MKRREMKEREEQNEKENLIYDCNYACNVTHVNCLRWKN